MGKMKELFQQREDDKMHIPDYPEEPDMCSNKTPQLQCPNCNKSMLAVDYQTGEATCYKCGYEFVQIGKNTVKYK
tara:strand:- start:19 stop:243 length:225 start_codon:yes stop_codon:yes gene_type:complete